jgi:hypothetical protein
MFKNGEENEIEETIFYRLSIIVIGYARVGRDQYTGICL